MLRARLRQPGLVARQIQKDHRHGRETEPAGRKEALVAADDGLVVKASYDRIDEAELPDGAGERVEFGIGDAPGVGGVGAQVVDRDMDDGEILVSLLH